MTRALPVSAVRRLLRKSRRQIETPIGQFADQTLKGLMTSLVAKITAFNRANYFHQLLGEPLLQVKEFAC